MPNHQLETWENVGSLRGDAIPAGERWAAAIVDEANRKVIVQATGATPGAAEAAAKAKYAAWQKGR